MRESLLAPAQIAALALLLISANLSVAAETPTSEAAQQPNEVTLSAEALTSCGIQVSPATRHSLHATMRVPGRISLHGDRVAHVGTTIQGRVTELKVKVGDLVQKGQELAVIDSPELGEAENDYLARKASVDVAKTVLELAATERHRVQVLYQSKAVSLSERQNRESDFLKAQAELGSAEAALRTARNKLSLLGLDDADTSDLNVSGRICSRDSVRAPIAGRVVERAVTLGESVGPDRESLMQIADLSVVWAVADVPEEKLANVHEASTMKLRVLALPGRSFEGKVTYVAPITDPDTRTGRINIELANPKGELRPGMFAEVEIELQSSTPGEGAQAVLAVPDDAVQTIEGSVSVFVPVKGKENTFARRSVKVGTQIGDMIPILGGVKEGEPVVVSGSFTLKAELCKGAGEEE